MLRRDFLRLMAMGALALCVGFGVSGCKSDSDQVKDTVSSLLKSYVVPVPNEDGEEPGDASWPAENYGDAATMDALQEYGVSPEDWRRHCFAHFSFEVGDAEVDSSAGTASVAVSVTNASLATAVEAAGKDFSEFSKTQEAEDAYASGGKAALFDHLVELVYSHLDSSEDLVTTSVKVSCSKDDEGNWVANVGEDKAFFAALYGGSDVISGLNATEKADESK